MGKNFDRWSARVVSFPNSTTRTHRLCLWPNQTHGQIRTRRFACR